MSHKRQNDKKKERTTSKTMLVTIQFSDKTKLYVDPKQRRTIKQRVLMEDVRTHMQTEWM